MRRSILALLLLLALARCQGVLPPYETVPAALPKAQQDAGGTPPTRVAVCYNALTTTAAAVRAIAAERCEAGTVPKAVDYDHSLNFCPLLQPARATFACTQP